MSKSTVTFPAGEYYIGDLCYVMHAEWNDVCNRLHQNERVESAFSIADGRTIFIASTAYGDGKFCDDRFGVYPVDSGTIGVIALNDISADDQKNITSGTVYTFNSEFNITAEGGIFNIGGILIDTKYNPYDEEEEENF